MAWWLVATGLAAAPPPAAFRAEGAVEGPAWSRDGHLLGFVVQGEGAPEVRIAEVTGTTVGATRVVVAPGGAAWADVVPGAFLASGRYVFSARVTGTEDPRLWEVDAASGVVAPLVSDAELAGPLGQAAPSDPLVFLGRKDGWPDLLARGDDGRLRRLTFSEDDEGHPFVDAAGQRILFDRRVAGAGRDIWSIGLDGGRERSVVSSSGEDVRPAVGARDTLVWLHRDDLWEIRAGDRVVATGVRVPTAGAPALSPDGEWIAFTHADRDRSSAVELVDVAGTRTVEIPSPLPGAGDPALVVQDGRLTLAFTALEADQHRVLELADVSGPVANPVAILGGAPPIPAEPEVADAAVDDEPDAAADAGEGGAGEAVEQPPEAVAPVPSPRSAGAKERHGGDDDDRARADRPDGRPDAPRGPSSDRGRGSPWIRSASGLAAFGTVLALVVLVSGLLVVEAFRRHLGDEA